MYFKAFHDPACVKNAPEFIPGKELLAETNRHWDWILYSETITGIAGYCREDSIIAEVRPEGEIWQFDKHLFYTDRLRVIKKLDAEEVFDILRSESQMIHNKQWSSWTVRWLKEKLTE